MPKELVDGRGRVAWAAAHSAWGRVLEVRRDEGASEVSSPFRRLGQYADDETGLCYTRFRYFDAEAGRWCSADPLGVAGGSNLLGFGGAPSSDADPFGLACERRYKPGPRAPDDLLLGTNLNKRRADNLTEWRRQISRSDIGAERLKFLGDDHVKVAPGVWRSIDGKRQFRTVPQDYAGEHAIGDPPVPNTPHVHFEFLDPPNPGGQNPRLVKNVHVPLVD